MKQLYRRQVILKKPAAGSGGYAFEQTGAALAACVLPMSGGAEAQRYGLRPNELRRMLCPIGADIQVGMGVCVDVSADAQPDYVVLYVGKWPRHLDVHMRLLPEQQRGVDE